MPTVSVIIPTYNRRAYLFETLATVWAQDFTDYEVIVVDDGSPDDTAEALRPLAEAGRLRYIKQPNAGQSTARNRGVAEARGEFIAFLDDDDLWPSDKLAWQTASLREHPEWIMVSGLAGLADPAGRTQEPAGGTDGTLRMLTIDAMFSGSSILSPGQVLLRRQTLNAAGGFDPAIASSEDTDLWMRLAARGPVALVRRCALYYRMHATNFTRAASLMFWNSVGVARKNLPLVPPERRGEAWRGGLRGTYMYAGSRVVCAAFGGGPRAILAAARVLAYLALHLPRDGALARMIGRDLLPKGLRRFLRVIKPLPAD